MKHVALSGLSIGNDRPLTVIAGPCQLQSADHAQMIAGTMAEACAAAGAQYIFKGSFDKANRSSLSGKRGLGLEAGLKALQSVRDAIGVPVLTDVHLPDQCVTVAAVADVLQIPAFLCRQTDLLIAAAETGAIINVKKGQFMAPGDMAHALAKLVASGCTDALLCERGTFFGYGRLVNDMRSIPQMQSLGVPVVFDATHSVQEPGGLGGATGGNREMVEPLARAAVAIGAEGLFCETHPDPDRSPSDGANIIALADIEPMMTRITAIRRALSEPVST